MIQLGVTDDPLTTGWTFSQSSSHFQDNGTVSTHRQLQQNGNCTAGDTAQIAKTVTGLLNGVTGFSVTFLSAGGGAGTETGTLFADGVSIASSGNVTTGSAVTISGTATVAGGQCVITLKLTANSSIGPVTRTIDIYALQLSVAAITFALGQGSFTYTGQTASFTVLRNYTFVLAQGAYTLTGYTLSFIDPAWTRGTKHTSAMTNGTKSTSSWTNSTKDASTFANQPKS